MKSSKRRAKRALAQLAEYQKQHPIWSGAVKIVDYRPPPGTYTPSARPMLRGWTETDAEIMDSLPFTR